jgi:hypothetical protein
VVVAYRHTANQTAHKNSSLITILWDTKHACLADIFIFMYYIDVKSTFGNESTELSTGTVGPVFTTTRTRARKWCKDLRNAPSQTLDVLVVGAGSGMAHCGRSPELLVAWHPVAAKRWLGLADVQRRACGYVQCW